MSGVPGMKRKAVRIATCHPEREHHAKGLCHPCYQFKINRELRSGVRVAKTRKPTVYPQPLVRVGVPGWGSR